MVFRRNKGFAKRPINSIKNIVDTSSVLAATTNTAIQTTAVAVDNPTLAVVNEVLRSSTINGVYFNCFFIAEGGEVANEVPLVDWYIIKDPGGNMQATGFTANGLPTPGASGTHENKRFILHTEKGLTGGGDASLAGIPMVFKGVIVIPPHLKRFRHGDKLTFVARANFATKFCIQAIYKWYS